MENNTLVKINGTGIKERLCNFGSKVADIAIRIYESPTTKWVVGGFVLLKFTDKVMNNDYDADIRHGESQVSVKKHDPKNS